MTRKTILSIAILFLLNTNLSFALKINFNDNLLYNGKEYEVDNVIFEKIFNKFPEIKIQPATYWVNHPKQYIVNYEVIKNKLWVTKIVMTVNDTLENGDTQVIYADVLPRIFKGKDKILADWLTCELYYYSTKWKWNPFTEGNYRLTRKYNRLTIKDGEIQRNRKILKNFVRYSKLKQYHKARRNKNKYNFKDEYDKGGELEWYKDYYCDFTTIIDFEKFKKNLKQN